MSIKHEACQFNKFPWVLHISREEEYPREIERELKWGVRTIFVQKNNRYG